MICVKCGKPVVDGQEREYWFGGLAHRFCPFPGPKSKSVVRKLPAASPRVEDGPIRFGDDWPGIFIRGDSAHTISFYLCSIIERLEKEEKIDSLSILLLKGFTKFLGTCVDKNK